MNSTISKNLECPATVSMQLLLIMKLTDNYLNNFRMFRTKYEFNSVNGCTELKGNNAKISLSGAVTHGTVVTVTCQPKYFLLFGDKYVTCQSTRWSHKPERRKCNLSDIKKVNSRRIN